MTKRLYRALVIGGILAWLQVGMTVSRAWRVPGACGISQIRKTRPCVIVSPDELNRHLRTVIVAPMTTGGHAYPFRPSCRFGGKEGRVVLDQLRTVDRDRLRKRLGALTGPTLGAVFAVLGEMFAFS